jgi:hypothetical protein
MQMTSLTPLVQRRFIGAATALLMGMTLISTPPAHAREEWCGVAIGDNERIATTVDGISCRKGQKVLGKARTRLRDQRGTTWVGAFRCRISVNGQVRSGSCENGAKRVMWSVSP